METALNIENLKYKYPDYPGLSFPVLFDNLNLTLKKGELRVVLGKPESGKTTLSRIITGLIPRFSGGTCSGTVEISGQSINGLKPYDLIGKAGIVFQNPDEQIITTRCDSEVAFTMESLGWPAEKMEDRIDRAFRLSGIEHLKTRDPATLSGGEKKKLLLASLFAVDPPLWILDETLEELDPASLKQLLEAIIVPDRTILIFATKIPPSLENYNAGYSLIYNGRIINREENSSYFEKCLEEEGIIYPKGKRPVFSGAGEKKLLLKAENISYAYSGQEDFRISIPAFELYRGETVSLVGRNGSGKSTLGKILCGLLKCESGSICIDDGRGNLTGADPARRNREAGFIFQNPDYQIFLPTVGEELSYGLDIEENTISRIIDLFRLPGKDIPPAIMSYGARKRLQGAVYYLFGKSLYIIDEADSGLSLDDFSRLVSLLKEKGAAVMIITHNMDLSRLYSNRIFIMNKGEIVKTADKDDFNSIDKFFLDGEYRR